MRREPVHIRRRREAGDLPGSVLDGERGWLVPVDELLAAGFRLNAPVCPPGGPVPVASSGADGQDDVSVEVAELRAELERQRHVRALAELEAKHLQGRLEERGQHTEGLQWALAALTPVPERAVMPQPSPRPSRECTQIAGSARMRRSPVSE